MLCIFSKILEKIVKKRLMPYLEKYKLLLKHQFGFRSGIRTVNAFYSATKFIYESPEKSKKQWQYFWTLQRLLIPLIIPYLLIYYLNLVLINHV